MKSTILLIALLLGSGATGLSAQEVVGFRRGDCNADGGINVSDVGVLLGALFGDSGPVPCEDACDATDNGALELGDVILLLLILFDGQGTLPPPADTCNGDPTGDDLTCAIAPCSPGFVQEEWVHTLGPARAGSPYLAALPQRFREQITWDTGLASVITQQEIPFQQFGVDGTSNIPIGLTLDTTTGTVSGSPLHAGTASVDFWAQTTLGQRVRIRTALSSFAPGELNPAPEATYTAGGPFAVAQIDTSFEFTHELPWPLPLPLYGCNPVPPPQLEFTLEKGLRIYQPFPIEGPRPLLIFHHGAGGYDGTDYDDLLSHLASHGIIAVSVTDLFPFFTVAAFYCWGGHDEAARVLLATRELIEGFAADPLHPLAGSVDPDRVFYAGHSRGGASAIIASELDRRTCGVIALQPTDAKGDSFIGNTSRWEHLPRVPMLLITAEQDVDVVFPFAERLLERLRGPSTMVTIFGGCHGLTTDFLNNGCDTCTWAPTAPFVDQCHYIARPLQHQLTELYATAFLARHGSDDLGAETLLYGDQNQTSALVGVAYQRRMGTTRLIDDFSQYPTSALGFPIAETNMMSIGVGSCYDTPDPPPAPQTPIENLVLELPFAGAAELSMPLGSLVAPLDATPHQRLLFRIKNSDRLFLVDNFGFGWLSLSLTLTDSFGNQATVPLGNHLPGSATHPQPEPAFISVLMKYQRYFTVAVNLQDFVAVNPALDLTQLVDLHWLWETDGSQETTPFIGLDDVVLE